MVTGIEPQNNPPVVQAGDDVVAEEQTEVTLSVTSVSDPEGVGISGYSWNQIAGPGATIANATTPTPTIGTPDVDEISELVFQVRVTDLNRAFGEDTCMVTVNNTDGSVAAPSPSISASSGGGGGGCFIDVLIQ
jgi:chitinase